MKQWIEPVLAVIPNELVASKEGQINCNPHWFNANQTIGNKKEQLPQA